MRLRRTSSDYRGLLFLAVCCGFAVIAAQMSFAQTNVQALNALSADLAKRYEKEHAAAIVWAANNDYGPLRVEEPDGTVIELMYVRDGRPVFYITENSDSADTVSTDEVHPGGSSGLDLDGSGVTLHIWDSGSVRSTHQEVTGRVIVQDGAGIGSHATHVGGTMIASGVDPEAHGMSPAAVLHSYSSSNDDAEMASAAAAGAQVSNHSYGTLGGWRSNGGEWFWYGDVTVSTTEDPDFGRYTSAAQSWDNIAFNAPYYLIVNSAGNDRNDSGPTPGGLHWHLNNGNFVQSTDTHPPDGGATGYDTMASFKNAKNILSVGATLDINGGYAGPGSVALTSFSSWGPSDDGRVKPDIIANGNSLYSSYSGSNTDYARLSGTSMAAPSTSGSLGLLIQHYRATHDGDDMRSATLKGLVIHTADEAGSADGPDYSNGWGLLNTLSAAQHISSDLEDVTAIQELTIFQGETIELVLDCGNDPFKATICWTDPPGTPAPFVVDSPDRKLVNDLDLRVIDGSGTAMPWVLDPLNPANPATTGDNDRDNVEVVENAAPVLGQCTVRITHKGALTDGPQDFSLLLTGIELPKDCNASGVTDSNELANCDGSLWCSDCNDNTILDGCEVSSGIALQFDPLESDLVQATSVPSLALGNASRTVEAWVYREDNRADQAIFTYGSTVDTQMFGLILSSACPDSVSFFGHNADVCGTGSIAVGVWSHVAVTYDGSSIKLYINGGEVGSTTPGPNNPLNTVLDANGLLIGARSDDPSASWGGMIDEFRVWNTVRSQTEIQDNRHNSLSGNEPGLVLYYNFEDGFGQSVLDGSANAQDGHLGSTAVSEADDPVRVLSDAPAPPSNEDLNSNGIPDACECPPSSQPQITEILDSSDNTVAMRTMRMIGIRLSSLDFGTLQGIRITANNLAPPFDVWNGQSMWVGEPLEYSELPGRGEDTPGPQGSENTFFSAELQCTPFMAPWSDFGDIVVWVRGEFIVPSTIQPGGGALSAASEYNVQLIQEGCFSTREDSYGTAATITSAGWGDIAQLASGEARAVNDNVAVEDTLFILQKFVAGGGAPGGLPIKARTDMLGVFAGPGPVLDLKITINETVEVISAFSGTGYPFAPSSGTVCP